MRAEAGDETAALLVAGTVLRFSKRRSCEFPPGDYQPDGDDFEFNSQERTLIENGVPVLLSVWDETLSAAEQLFSALPHLGSKVVLRLGVPDILVISCPLNGRALKVQREALEQRFPGSDGHCGIAGLTKLDCPDKLERRKMRRRLAVAAEVVAVNGSL